MPVKTWDAISQERGVGLRQSADRGHRRSAKSDQQLSCTDQGESFLLLDGAMRNRPKDLRIETRVTSWPSS
jgi:hypothetical protein